MDIELNRKVKGLLDKGTRLDGRKADQFREVSIEFGASVNACGSARVKIGETEVIAGVTMEVMKPYPDSADKGSLMVNVELYPLSNPDFESGPPSIYAIELARVTDRTIREGKMVNFKKLCITEGEKAWTAVIDICSINDAGNLWDAIPLAAVAALKDTKLPAFDGEKLDYKNLTKEGLPIDKWPLSTTVFKYGKHLLVDPDYDELQVYDSRLSIAVLDNGNLCSLQKGGYIPFTSDDVSAMVDLAVAKTNEFRKILG